MIFTMVLCNNKKNLASTRLNLNYDILIYLPGCQTIDSIKIDLIHLSWGQKI
jgi:hypothetical protein